MTFLMMLWQNTTEGPTLGPFQLLPQSLGAWLAIIMSAASLWTLVKQRAAKSADLDGLGARVGNMQKDVAEMKGKVDALGPLIQTFITSQTAQSERIGQMQRVVDDCDNEGKELRRDAILRLDRLREDQATYATRLTRMEERMKITS